jgi:hypothetical protein
MRTSSTPSRPVKGRIQTEADAKSVDGRSGQSKKSSHDMMSHNKAGTKSGAGGGKKRERHH